FNILLQILDDGQLTDSKGRLVDFKNTIIIMTSNIGSEYLLEGNTPENNELVMSLLKTKFKPEFLNRIDEIIMFNPLDVSLVNNIIKKFFMEIAIRLQADDIIVEIDDLAINAINEFGYDISYGARPLKRYIQKNVETLIAKEIIKGNVNNGDHILISYEDNQFIIKHL
ncbi:MAG: AAA family ATPase, partial [Bacilli bacterium]